MNKILSFLSLCATLFLVCQNRGAFMIWQVLKICQQA